MFNFSNSVFKLRSISESDVIKDIRTFMLPGENIVSAFQSGRDQVVFTDKRIIALDVKGITGSRKEFSTLPYSQIVHFTVQTPGFLEFNNDSELVVAYPNGALIQFEFSGGNVNILEIAQIISRYVL
ncbi:PH domain-containing protein [uncultured Phascolarctobacterium sp.]|uniref:PH domain-containing protein n=1 Tax=uncultured Phascolarctobacterium sp. TaxID=512296 RepID=UPI0025E05F9A|nr:PH domain-containing protein [uncultured Phascolarctobacterium sp.]